VSVTNTFPYTLHQLRKSFGGTVRLHTEKEVGRRTYYQWRIYGDAAIDFVKLLLPHLWEKRLQAELLLALRAEKPGPKRDGLARQLGSMKQIDYTEEEDK